MKPTKTEKRQNRDHLASPPGLPSSYTLGAGFCSTVPPLETRLFGPPLSANGLAVFADTGVLFYLGPYSSEY